MVSTPTARLRPSCLARSLTRPCTSARTWSEGRLRNTARRASSREASIRRIVTGLSRSVSADSVVDTVITDLRSATDADHVVVARVKPNDEVRVAEKSRDLAVVRASLDALSRATPVSWISVDTEKAIGLIRNVSNAAE